jgi:Rhodopirellula transposase DDE domain
VRVLPRGQRPRLELRSRERTARQPRKHVRQVVDRVDFTPRATRQHRVRDRRALASRGRARKQIAPSSDRNAQFEPIQETIRHQLAANEPTFSVDTKKRELVAEYKIIAATTTKAARRGRSHVAPRTYAKGRRVSDAQLAEVHLAPNAFQGNRAARVSRHAARYFMLLSTSSHPLMKGK